MLGRIEAMDRVYDVVTVGSRLQVGIPCVIFGFDHNRQASNCRLLRYLHSATIPISPSFNRVEDPSLPPFISTLDGQKASVSHSAIFAPGTWCKVLDR